MSDQHPVNGSNGAKPMKDRSPSFPYIGLTKAFERAEQLYGYAKRHDSRILDAAKPAWDMGAKSSSTLQTVAALLAFGLIEDSGSGDNRKIKVSELAYRALVDQRPGAKEAALAEAALKPKLIAEFAALWSRDRPPEANCLSELTVERNFTPDGAKAFLRVFDDTIRYAKLPDSDKKSDAGNVAGDMNPMPQEIAVGDLVQWEAGGVLRLDKPAAVRAIQEYQGTKWVFVDGSETGIPMDEVQIERKGTPMRAPPTLPLAMPPSNDEKHTPPPGLEVDRFTLDEGVVRVEFPKDMGAASVEELEQFFSLFIKKAKRRATL